MHNIFDSHCHIYDRHRYRKDIDDVLSRMQDNGVSQYMLVGTNLSSSAQAINFAEHNKGAYATVGIHPHAAKNFHHDDLFVMDSLLHNKTVKAVGEIGLDFYRNISSHETQIAVCEMLIDFAHEHCAPIVYHVREAHTEMIELLSKKRDILHGGVIHCFSSDWEAAREYLDLGMHISFAANVLSPEAAKLHEAAKHIPEEHLLIETDSPFLAPPITGSYRNEPANIKYVLEKLAALRDVTSEHLADITTANAQRLFQINS